jgi:UDP-N-acetylglucosamine acyltransferase
MIIDETTISEVANIDPSAIVHKSACIGDHSTIGSDVEIHANAVIGDNVEIGSGTIIESHVVIHGPTRIGTNNHIYSFASIGGDPQDAHYEEGEDSHLVIGNDNIIREFCTINRGIARGEPITKIGSSNMLMANVHIANDCRLGDHIIIANNATLAGYVEIQDWAILGGFTLVKQHCMIGMHTYIGMGCQINKDIPSYMVASGAQTRIRSYNLEGMRRRGFSPRAIGSIGRAFRVVYRESQGRLLDHALVQLEESESDSPEVMQFVKCIRSSKAGIMSGLREE